MHQWNGRSQGWLYLVFLSQKKVSGILNHEDWLPILIIGLLLLLVSLEVLQSALFWPRVFAIAKKDTCS